MSRDNNPGLNVEILCKGVGMGRANFYRKLKAITDLSPVDLIRNKRLEIAARMLLETDMNISEVSANISFQFYCLFCYLFQNDGGMSPTEYVQQNKKNLYHV
ncbi:MAG: helix-turn-helix transcriptional regulator [Parabacteroides merdae]